MKVVIVGGVAGGASTAARLRRLDEQAEIVVLERGEQVSYANCGLPYHIGGVIKKRDALFVQTPGKLRLILKIDVRIRSEAIAIDQARKTIRIRDEKTGEEYDESWNKLVLCPGSRPADLGVPGEDLPGVYHLHTVADMDAIKKSSEPMVIYALLNAVGLTGPKIESVALQLFGSKATAVMTNVPGPREEIYLAGKAMRSMMFWVPQSARLGLGVSILSYAGQVRLGVATDSGLVPDPETIIEAFQEEMAEMMNEPG